jgi:DNA-binding LacI/PurR family transcriptional regulator
MSSDDPRGLLPVARRARLLEALRAHETVRISELTQLLGVTAVTVRRDIAQLASEGRVRRVHGGVTLTQRPDSHGEPAQSEPGDHDFASGAGAAGRWPTIRDTKHTVVGILVPSLDYYWPGVVRGVEEAARARQLRVMLRGSSYDNDDDRSQLARLIESGVDGLLFAPNLGAPKAAETMAWLATTGVPVVLVERTATIAPHDEVMESVVTDHALGAAMAVRHLASLGHRKIGVVTAERSPTSPHLRRGWAEALTDLGLRPADTVEARVPSPQAPSGDDAFDAALRDCMRNGTTALLVHADAEAMALVQRCEARGIAVPGELSIVAYDDEVASLFSPALSAVRPPRRSIGRAAIDLLTARLADPGRPTHRVVISPTLHVRQSSSAPPT